MALGKPLYLQVMHDTKELSIPFIHFHIGIAKLTIVRINQVVALYLRTAVVMASRRRHFGQVVA